MRIALAPARALARSASAGGAALETEAERAVDAVMAGPLPEAFARMLVEHRVIDRVVAELAASGELQRMAAGAAADARTAEIARQVLQSPAFRELVVETAESDMAAEVIEQVAGSPRFQAAVAEAVRSVLAHQTASLADTMAARAQELDTRIEAPPRRWFRGATPARPGHAGLASRAAALAVDLVTVHVVYLVGAAMAALIGGVLSFDASRPLAVTLASTEWVLVVSVYFTVFWAAAGRTPGMSLMRLRVMDKRGRNPGVLRSLLRLAVGVVGLAAAFLGFAPVLVDDRRRALQDMAAGTVVTYRGAEPGER